MSNDSVIILLYVVPQVKVKQHGSSPVRKKYSL